MAIEWIMVVFIHGTTDYDVWGGYSHLSNCQKTMTFLEKRYVEKHQPLKVQCWPVTSTIKIPKNIKITNETE